MLTNDDLLIEKGEKSFNNDFTSIMTILFSMLYAYIVSKFFFAQVSKYNLFFSHFLKLINFFSRKFFFDNIYFYICKIFFFSKNFVKEEKNFNENSFIFFIKEKKEKIVKLISFIFFNKILLALFIIIIIGNVLLTIMYPSIVLI